MDHRGNWKHREKAKQLSSGAGMELKSLSDQQDSLHKNVCSLTGVRDTDRGITYARRIQEKSREKQINLPLILHGCVGAHRWQRSVPLICRLQPC